MPRDTHWNAGWMGSPFAHGGKEESRTFLNIKGSRNVMLLSDLHSVT
jgi:hypothetical protein